MNSIVLRLGKKAIAIAQVLLRASFSLLCGLGGLNICGTSYHFVYLEINKKIQDSDVFLILDQIHLSPW